jgi:hypothetical protein
MVMNIYQPQLSVCLIMAILKAIMKPMNSRSLSILDVQAHIMV